MEIDYKPEYTITSEMLDLVVKITEHLTKLDNLSNLLKQPHLRRVSRLRTVQASCAIEGNSLTFDQVTAVVNGKIVLAPQNEILEIKNAFEAYKLLEKINPYEINEMLKVHEIMMSGGLVEKAGQFRTKEVGVFNAKGETTHVAPPATNVKALVGKLFNWLETEKINELIKFSIFHYEFEFIHPFSDGNGRVGRFMQSALLAKWKPIFAYIPVETIIKQEQQEYYTAFQNCYADGGKSNHFVVFMLKAILKTVAQIHTDSSKMIKSQTAQIQKLMEIMEYEPISAKDLATKLGLKSTLGLKQNYLDPALKLGLIEMTEPDKPTSKHQKYFKK